MHTGRSAKRITAKDRVIERNGPMASLSSFVAVFTQADQIIFNPAQEFQINQQLIHRGVADSLSHAERRPMYLICASFNSRDGIDDSQTAVLMPVPVKPDLFALLVDYPTHKLH